MEDLKVWQGKQYYDKVIWRPTETLIWTRKDYTWRPQWKFQSFTLSYEIFPAPMYSFILARIELAPSNFPMEIQFVYPSWKCSDQNSNGQTLSNQVNTGLRASIRSFSIEAFFVLNKEAYLISKRKKNGRVALRQWCIVSWVVSVNPTKAQWPKNMCCPTVLEHAEMKPVLWFVKPGLCPC